MRNEGYDQLSARQVAERAGLKTQLLNDYFRTINDVVLAVVRKVNARRFERLEAAFAAPDPLTALWAMNCDPSSAVLAV